MNNTNSNTERIKFDYDKWLTGNYKAVTRDGIEVSKIEKTHDFYPIKALINGEEIGFSINGKYDYHSFQHFFDLFLEPIIPSPSKEESKERLYNRKEVIKLLRKCFKAGGDNRMKPFTTDLAGVYCPNIDQWIEDNLKP